MLDLPSLASSARLELGLRAPNPARVAAPAPPVAPAPAVAGPDVELFGGNVRGLLGPSSAVELVGDATPRTSLMGSRVSLAAEAPAPPAPAPTDDLSSRRYGDTLIAPHLLARPVTPRYDAVHQTIESLGGKYRPSLQLLEDVANGSRGVLDATQAPSMRSARTAASRELATLYADGIAQGERVMPRAPRIEGNRVDLLVRNEQYLPRLYEDLRGARRSITVNQFNWEPDGSGAIVADVLRQKAIDGLDVRVIMDGYGIKEKGTQVADDFQRSLEQVGVKFVRTDSFKPGGNGFEHRKLITVDDNIAYTGGLGFGQKYDTWTDLMLRVEGPAAAVAGASQLATFREVAGAPDDRLASRAAGIGQTLRDAADGARGVAGADAAVTFFDNTPDRDLAATEAFLRDAAAAKERFWATSTYLTTNAARDALVDAARRGVDVKLLVTGPKAGNDAKQVWLGRTLMQDMLDAGVEVYEYPSMLHAKSWLRDDDVAAVGSMNLSMSSMARSRELTARVEDASFAERYARFHEQTRRQADAVTPKDLDSMKVKALGLLNKVGLQF